MDTTFEILLRQPIKLTDDLKRAIREADTFKHECQELGTHVEAIDKSLRAIVRSLGKHGNGYFCDRPTSRIMEETSRTLENCYVLVKKCKKGHIFRRLIAITSVTDFRKVSNSVDSALENLKWLYSVATDDDVGVPGVPPIAGSRPSLAMIWAMITKIQIGTPKVREEAAAYLTNLANSEQNAQLIVAEGGVPQLLRLLNDGTLDAQLMAALALGNLAAHQQLVKRIAGDVIPAFVQILSEGSMQLQANVAWALAEMVSNDPDTQGKFGSANVIKPLVALMLETIDDMAAVPSPLKVVSMQMQTTLPVERSRKDLNGGGTRPSETRFDAPVAENGTLHAGMDHAGVSGITKASHFGNHNRSVSDSPYHGSSPRAKNRKQRENPSLEVKNDLKKQVTRALWLLAKKNTNNCKAILESTKAMLGFAKLIEKEQGEVQRNVIMTVMELAEAAEIDDALRKLAFNPSSPGPKAVVDQLLKIIKDPSGEPNLQVSCIKTIGCLARTFRATQNGVISCLVTKLCGNNQNYLLLASEAVRALLKFVGSDNFLHLQHSQTIVEAATLPYLVQLAASDEDTSEQFSALILLSQLALHVGRLNKDAFQETAALSVLKSVATSPSAQDLLVQLSLEGLVNQAIQHLEFCQAEGYSPLDRLHD